MHYKLPLIIVFMIFASSCTNIKKNGEKVEILQAPQETEFEPEYKLVADSGFAAPALAKCNTDLRYLNQVVGWQVAWPRRWQGVVARGAPAAATGIQEWIVAPKAIAASIDQLRLGISRNQTAPRPVVIRVHQQVRDLLVMLKQSHSKYLFTDTSNSAANEWNNLVQHEVVPAVSSFEQFLRREYLPASQQSPGLYMLKGGAECFANAIAWWTSLSPELKDVDRIGWLYLNDSMAELLATGQLSDTAEGMLAQLREKMANDQTTTHELIAVSKSALVRAEESLPHVFSQKVLQPIVVEEMPGYMQGSAPAGYYGGAEGNTPARYIINTSRPNERRLMAEVIAFHEGIPGHHLWNAYPRGKPVEFNNSGLSEGWAIYAEYLADEMGLYGSILDRQGMIAKHLWAASRLIVEPGLHLNGWSREKAIRFMLNNTVMSRTEIEIEVDRYTSMPGQSLSYILGANFILTERRRAQKILGSRFKLAEFHDVILLGGGRPLPQVRDDIGAWLDLKKSELLGDSIKM